MTDAAGIPLGPIPYKLLARPPGGLQAVDVLLLTVGRERMAQARRERVADAIYAAFELHLREGLADHLWLVRREAFRFAPLVSLLIQQGPDTFWLLVPTLVGDSLLVRDVLRHVLRDKHTPPGPALVNLLARCPWPEESLELAQRGVLDALTGALDNTSTEALVRALHAQGQDERVRAALVSVGPGVSLADLIVGQARRIAEPQERRGWVRRVAFGGGRQGFRSMGIRKFDSEDPVAPPEEAPRAAEFRALALQSGGVAAVILEELADALPQL